MIYTCEKCGMLRGKTNCNTCQLFDIRIKLS
jgi:hypothetical protein